jgi:hypothetical protein
MPSNNQRNNVLVFTATLGTQHNNPGKMEIIMKTSFRVLLISLVLSICYLCGRFRIPASFNGGSLLSMSYNGEINWSWEQEGRNISEVDGCHGSPSAALLALDNEDCIYWAWGQQELYGAQIITKLLPNGQLPIEDEVQTPPVSTISAYPNPMKDEITIKIKQDDQSISAENKLNIFNIKGQFVRSLKLTKGETVWDGKDRSGKPCPKGIYLLRYQYGTSHVTKICKTH